jgi:hypothetical protein
LSYLSQENGQVSTKIRSVSSVKTDEKASPNTAVIFNFGVNMEEADRTEDSVRLNFQMIMDTEPAIAKFTVEGSTTIRGSSEEIEHMLSPDPETNVPFVFTRIYQQVYAVIFMLAGTIEVPYPSPALLKRAHVKRAMSSEIQA